MNNREVSNDIDVQRCFKAATNYLGYRPRSEPELRQRLTRRGFTLDSIDRVIIELKRLKLVDDDAFAAFWRDNRESFSPRSKALTRKELKQKGLSDDIVDRAVSSINDEDSAYRAALRKAGRLSRSDYQSFRRRLGGYLQRRGFNYGVIEHTVRQVWQEGTSDLR
jgi:regulatory protein